MTGEITLSGNVLPIGGVKEKFLAAKRAGVKDVIFPAENKTNVEEDLMPEQIEGVSVHYVSTIEEVLEIALPSTPAKRSGTPKSASTCSPEQSGRGKKLKPQRTRWLTMPRAHAVFIASENGRFRTVTLRAQSTMPHYCLIVLRANRGLRI